MDFLNQSFAQLKDLFDGMTPGSRITAGLLLVVVVVSLGYLFTHAVPGNDVYLLDGRSFAGSELAAIEAALGEAGLISDTDGGRIRVPRGKKYEYMAALVQADALPEGFGEDLRKTLENQTVFSSWKLTEEQIKASMLREMGKTISAMPGVERAVVVSARQEKRGLFDDDVVTATVDVWMLGSRAVDQKLANQICGTVMGGVGGVTPENIRVNDNTNGLNFRGSTEDLTGTAGGSFAAITQYHETRYREKILDFLRDIRGATVACNVQLNREKSTIKESVEHDPKETVTVELSDKTRSRTFEGAEPAGRPGAVAQANTTRSLGTSQGKGSKDTVDESELEQSSISANSARTETVMAGLVPEQVFATIGIPSTYIEDIWHQDNDKPGEEPKTPDPNELVQLEQTEVAKIKNSVVTLLQTTNGVDDLTELVTVRVYRVTATEPIPETGMTENAMLWLGQSWQVLGLMGLALVSLLMIRSMAKPAPAVAAAAEAPTPGAVAGEEVKGEGDSAEQPASPALARFGTSGKSLKDELSDLVAEDPDSAANVLRNWIGYVSNVA